MPDVAANVIRISLANVGSLIDQENPAEFPYTGPVVKEGAATFLESAARERRKPKSIQLEIALNQAAIGEPEEARVRETVHRYFATSTEEAAREVRVNRIEGWASAWYAVPIVLITLAVSGIFYFFVAVQEASLALDFFSTFLYLLFITVVWVMLWDPIEKILFVGFERRCRKEALEKLSHADVRFVYQTRA